MGHVKRSQPYTKLVRPNQVVFGSSWCVRSQCARTRCPLVAIVFAGAICSYKRSITPVIARICAHPLVWLDQKHFSCETAMFHALWAPGAMYGGIHIAHGVSTAAASSCARSLCPHRRGAARARLISICGFALHARRGRVSLPCHPAPKQPLLTNHAGTRRYKQWVEFYTWKWERRFNTNPVWRVRAPPMS